MIMEPWVFLGCLIVDDFIFSRSLAEACSDGDVNAVRKLLDEGRSVNEHTEEGESLLCLACSAGYYELAQVSRSNLWWLKLLKGFDVLSLIKKLYNYKPKSFLLGIGKIETDT